MSGMIQNRFADVICQYTRDGRIIPLRVRLQDDDGMYQTYTIKSYKELSHAGSYKTPYGTISHSSNWNFLCRVQILDKLITMELFFNGSDNLWRIVRIS